MAMVVKSYETDVKRLQRNNSTVRNELNQFSELLQTSNRWAFFFMCVHSSTKYLLVTYLGSDTFNDAFLSSITEIINTMEITRFQESGMSPLQC